MVLACPPKLQILGHVLVGWVGSSVKITCYIVCEAKCFKYLFIKPTSFMYIYFNFLTGNIRVFRGFCESLRTTDGGVPPSPFNFGLNAAQSVESY